MQDRLRRIQGQKQIHGRSAAQAGPGSAAGTRGPRGRGSKHLAGDDDRFHVPHIQLRHGRVLLARGLWRRVLPALLLPGPWHALPLPAPVREDAAGVATAGEPQDGGVAARHHAHCYLFPVTGALVSDDRG